LSKQPNDSSVKSHGRWSHSKTSSVRFLDLTHYGDGGTTILSSAYHTRTCGGILASVQMYRTAVADTAGVTTGRLAATELIIILANRYACLRNGHHCPLSRKSAGASDFLLLYLTRTLKFFFFSVTIGIDISCIWVSDFDTRGSTRSTIRSSSSPVCVCVVQSAQ